MGDPDWAAASWLQPGLDLAIAAIWEENIANTSGSLCLSNKLKIDLKNFRRKKHVEKYEQEKRDSQATDSWDTRSEGS